MANPATRPDSFVFHNGEKATLPFSPAEYEHRLRGLRVITAEHDLSAVLLTSMHTIAYYSGFLYCSFGRRYACVVTEERCVTISANIDGGQPWRRSVTENVVYTDWRRDNYWRAVRDELGSPALLWLGVHHFVAVAELSFDHHRPQRIQDHAACQL